ncbi:MAG: hypothetical protein JST33_02750 [Actinobacteria bacterium]|nr:hypothetical protein [Actinomycetota bacterium]
MSAYEEWARSTLGAWAIPVLIATPVLLWLINKLPGWISAQSSGLRGSPTSSKYWRSRHAEALAQRKDMPAGPEAEQLDLRATEARIMVEAHEALRRIGPDPARPFWMGFWVFVPFTLIFGTWWLVERSGVLAFTAAVALIVLLGCEIAAVLADTVVTARFNALVAAGRKGHSNLVRADPWRVLRRYDEWRSHHNARKKLSARTKADASRVSKRVRIERNFFGLPVRPSGIEIDTDIWVDDEPDRPADPSV